jgi:hypothetical protein
VSVIVATLPGILHRYHIHGSALFFSLLSQLDSIESIWRRSQYNSTIQARTTGTISHREDGRVGEGGNGGPLCSGTEKLSSLEKKVRLLQG